MAILDYSDHHNVKKALSGSIVGYVKFIHLASVYNVSYSTNMYILNGL